MSTPSSVEDPTAVMEMIGEKYCIVGWLPNSEAAATSLF